MVVPQSMLRILTQSAQPQIIHESWNNGSPTPEFNNAGQVFNHDFYWESMAPNGGGALMCCQPLSL